MSPFWSLPPTQEVTCVSAPNQTHHRYTFIRLELLHTPQQAQAKQQKRQILARQEEAKVGGRERGTSDAGGPTPALLLSAYLTDGEGTSLPRRDRRRYWQAGRASEASGGCLSDSEVVMCDNSSASRCVLLCVLGKRDRMLFFPKYIF